MNERAVQISNLSEAEAVDRLRGEIGLEKTADEVGNAVPRFTEVEYANFKAKHAVVGDDLVVQFYLPDRIANNLQHASANVKKSCEEYWLTTFPQNLSDVAKHVFNADKPRIIAKYTEELASWWFKARGFGLTIDPDALACKFEQELNVSFADQQQTLM